MGVRTGFWVNGSASRILWARDNGSDKRSELWELTVSFDAYEWRDVSDRFREYGFTGYLAILRFQGWTCVQQPNGFTKNVVEMPKLPYPSAMLNGGTVGDGGWEYMPPADIEPSADTVAMHTPARWVCDRAECADDTSDLDEAAMMDAEPEPVTQEIPEIPAQTTVKAVSYASLPDMLPARECPELQGLGRIRHFRTSEGRKVAYVASANGKCVVAYRERYKRGSDRTLEKAVADYVHGLGYEIAA
ncbi:hypothetical protein [Bifidobacterium myosotis]|uniref:hypothetical protein n=1 Tax=Bifidobacterium myosotis TaxID=1630166 RepID=UPI001CC2D53A|nr:hypothetical protein [Bifidobacterium myosotis]